MTELKPTVSVVIPVYNSAAILPELISQLEAVLPALCQRHEIILINDGSRDERWEVISRLANQNANLRGINMMRNYGQHNALLCGIRNAATSPVADDMATSPLTPRSAGKRSRK